MKAPRAGLLLHGSIRDYRPGGSPSRLKRGSTIPARADAFLVADPERFAVALALPESLRATPPDGSDVTARPVGRPDLELRGTLALEAFPASRKGGESVFAGTVALESGPWGLVVGTHVAVEAETTEP